MKSGYRIQWIPLSGTGKAKSITFKRWQLRLLTIFSIILVFLVFLVALHHARIAVALSTTEYLKEQNSHLLSENNLYRHALAILDSVIEEQERIQTAGRILIAPIDSVPELHALEGSLLNDDELEQHIQKFELDSTYNEEARPNIKPVVGIITQEWKEGDEQHYGIDIAAPLHDPVYATAPGIVSTLEKTNDLGLTVVIDHGEGFQTLYAHLGRALIKRGDPVYRGTPIGTIGMTGNTSGPHLHYEVRLNGEPQNPSKYFVD